MAHDLVYKGHHWRRAREQLVRAVAQHHVLVPREQRQDRGVEQLVAGELRGDGAEQVLPRLRALGRDELGDERVPRPHGVAHDLGARRHQDGVGPGADDGDVGAATPSSTQVTAIGTGTA
ncbi:hypothetical protein AB0F91_29575 [Amycolatopsis sp. NPDC023774]|uniref:hypothetical protein n=1 Tax=Amycolatopsis sp. NPDC023774 TaxID=3155015 RepID=UPI0033E893C4